MRLHYYACSTPNFGDELNPWLWPRLLPELIDGREEDGLFVGIGTLLNSFLPTHPRTIIFGTGIGYGPVPRPLPGSWKIYGVRGPLSAQALGLPLEAVIGDAAILLRTLPLPPVRPIHPVAFMPHYQSTILGAWPAVCRTAGIHYINPTDPVETVLSEIRSSRRLITSAMHGAIVADAFRIPWTPVRPFSEVHSAKWLDWVGALDCKFKFAHLPPSTPDEHIEDRMPRLRYHLVRRQWRRKPPLEPPPGMALAAYPRPFVPDAVRAFLTPFMTARAAAHLRRLGDAPSFLSGDDKLEAIISRLLERLELLRLECLPLSRP